MQDEGDDSDSDDNKYDEKIKIMVIGETKVGKTSLIKKYTKDVFGGAYLSTVGIDFQEKIINIDGKSVMLQIWDTAGQERFNSIVSNYYKGTDVAIFLYSIDKEESFQNVEKWVKNLKQNNENSLNVLIGNKKDREKEEGGRVVTYERAEKFAEENNFFSFREITCKVGDEDEVKNISEIFDEIAKYFYDKSKENKNKPDTNDLKYVVTDSMMALGKKHRVQKEGDQNKKKKCC